MLLIMVGLGVATAAVIAVTVGRSRARARIRETERNRQDAQQLEALQRDAGSALVRADERVRLALPSAQATLMRLAERYSAAALAPVAANPEQAGRLLEFAARSADVAQSRLQSSRDGEAESAAHAAAETVRRAEELLVAVEGFEVEALHAESTLAAMVAESRAELAAAHALPDEDRRGRIDSAIVALAGTLAELPNSSERLDPVASLTAVRRTNSALDAAIADRIQRAERRERLRTQLVTAIDDAERQIAAARELISDYRAPIGPDARTRLAEAERELAQLTDEREPEPALARARRAASLASDAAAYARADIERGRGYGVTGTPGHQRAGSGVLGAVLGGLAIGGRLDDLGGVGDFFD